MANPSRRVLHGLRSLHPRPLRADPLPSQRFPIFSSISNPRPAATPRATGARGSSSSFAFPAGVSDPVRSRPVAPPCSFSGSPMWRRAVSHRAFSDAGAAPRGFSPKLDHCFAFRNWRGSCSNGIPNRSGVSPFGGSLLTAGFSSSAKVNTAKAQGTLGRSLAAKPLDALTSVASRYREAVGLQVEAFWKRNYLVLVGAAGVALCIALWRIMFGVASTFVGLSEGMAKYGFLALASAIVAFAGLYLRSRFTINPDRIYRIAMRKLNTSAGILEIMGAPLAGTDVRAYVMSGGGPRLKNFKLRFGGKRCFLIFPIRGSERKGLVSVEAKKKKGQYDIKLLAVDIPMATGPDHRVFLTGDEAEYKVGGGLISELRDPILKAMAAEKEFEDLDLKEEEEDEKRQLAEEERKRQEEMINLEKKGS